MPGKFTWRQLVEEAIRETQSLIPSILYSYIQSILPKKVFKKLSKSWHSTVRRQLSELKREPGFIAPGEQPSPPPSPLPPPPPPPSPPPLSPVQIILNRINYVFNAFPGFEAPRFRHSFTSAINRDGSLSSQLVIFDIDDDYDINDLLIDIEPSLRDPLRTLSNAWASIGVRFLPTTGYEYDKKIYDRIAGMIAYTTHWQRVEKLAFIFENARLMANNMEARHSKPIQITFSLHWQEDGERPQYRVGQEEI